MCNYVYVFLCIYTREKKKLKKESVCARMMSVCACEGEYMYNYVCVYLCIYTRKREKLKRKCVCARMMSVCT